MEASLRIVLAAILVLTISASGILRHRADASGGRVERRRDGPLVVVLLLLTAGAVYGTILVYLVRPAWIAWSRFDLPAWLQWTGIGLVAIGAGAATWSLYHLGRNVTPTAEVRPGATLVESGPYRRVRHPLYASGVPFLAGMALVTASWLVVAGGLAAMAVLAYRTRREEANLVAHFGDAYRRYMARTGRYWPRIGGPRSRTS